MKGKEIFFSSFSNGRNENIRHCEMQEKKEKKKISHSNLVQLKWDFLDAFFLILTSDFSRDEIILS